MTPRLPLWLDRTALTATLLAPVFLTHGRGLAEAAISLVAACFLARSAVTRDWRWLRTSWVRIGLLWWGWLLLCSLPGIGESGSASLLQAALTGRFLLFVAALEHWVLREAWRRLWLGRLVRVAALYIVAQEALQFLTGRNLFGYGRSVDGELTGPYEEARAAPVLSRLLFPAILPPAASWFARGGLWRAASAALALGGVAAMVLFGQRMPVLLTGLGLVVSALLLPRLRGLVLAAAVAGVALVCASAVVAPPTFYRLVTKFSAQMSDWPDSPYGQLASRALAIAEANPWTGRGFDAFRNACAMPQYWHGWDDVLAGRTGMPDLTLPRAPQEIRPTVRRLGGGAVICTQHPHNHYLQAVAEAGIPGLLLFCALVGAWLAGVGRGLRRNPDPLRVGLFAAVLIQEWPLASTSAFTNLPLGGWFFLLLGFGLAEARRLETDPERAYIPDEATRAGRDIP